MNTNGSDIVPKVSKGGGRLRMLTSTGQIGSEVSEELPLYILSKKGEVVVTLLYVFEGLRR